MPVKTTIQIGHPALKSPNHPITQVTSVAVKRLVKDLQDTMEHEGLIGMAAPQIAKNFTVFVTRPRKTKHRTEIEDEFRVYINPKISSYSTKQVNIYEGCGSVLHGQLFGPVIRPQTITVEAFNLDGHRFILTCDGILSRVVQHEYDHLSGIEFTEKIADYRQLMYIDYYVEQIKNSPEQIENSRITKLEYQII